MTALEEIKKALEEVTPERVERLWWFLHILAKSTGTTNAEDDKWNWINAFCTDYEDDTFNLAAKLGFITVRHDSFMETSTARITKAGMALVTHFDKAPSASLTSTLESLQRENEELRQRLDIGPCGEDAIDVAESAADHLRHRAEAAEAEVKRYRVALIAAKTRMRNCRGAIESNQVVDKDVHGSLQNGICDIEEALSAAGPLAAQAVADKEPSERMLLAGSLVDWKKYSDKKEAARDVWNVMHRNAGGTALANTGGEHNAE